MKAREFSQLISGQNKGPLPHFQDGTVIEFTPVLQAQQEHGRPCAGHLIKRQKAESLQFSQQLLSLIRCPARVSVGREISMSTLLMNK